jgi:hypothetical protein
LASTIFLGALRPELLVCFPVEVKGSGWPELTKAGRQQLERKKDAWEKLTTAVAQVLRTEVRPNKIFNQARHQFAVDL